MNSVGRSLGSLASAIVGAAGWADGVGVGEEVAADQTANQQAWHIKDAIKSTNRKKASKSPH